MLIDDIYKKIEQEALGPVNRYFAWQKLRRTPDQLEAMDHFLENRGQEYVLRTMGIEHIVDTSARPNMS
jgi:hypothetical protein